MIRSALSYDNSYKGVCVTPSFGVHYATELLLYGELDNRGAISIDKDRSIGK